MNIVLKEKINNKNKFFNIISKLTRRVGLRNIGVLIGLIIIIIFLSILSDAFLTTRNLLNVLRQASIVGSVAIGMTFVLITGAFDLSVGATMGFVGVIVISLQPIIGVWPAIIVALLSGALIGLINGVIVSKLRVNPFITTLGMMGIIRGLILITAKGRTIYSKSEIFGKIGSGYFGKIPMPVIIFGFFIIFFGFILSKTMYGRYVYAVGGNPEASIHSGINVTFYKLTVFILAGFCAAIGGIILASRLMSVSPSAGSGYELDAIAAVIIGGTSISGGEGNMWRTGVGIIVLVIISNGLNILNVNEYAQLVVKGLIIITAVAIDVNTKGRSS